MQDVLHDIRVKIIESISDPGEKEAVAELLVELNKTYYAHFEELVTTSRKQYEEALAEEFGLEGLEVEADASILFEKPEETKQKTLPPYLKVIK
jgi:hypothetical protein